MTHKYLEVRRAMYEINPTSKISSRRKFSDMVKLFKAPYLIMLVLLFLSIISYLILIIFFPNSPLLYVLIPTMVILPLLSQISREEYLYNVLARQEELTEMSVQYTQYIIEIKMTLRNHGIDTPEKVLHLKHECETSLNIRDEKYNKLSSKTIDMLIGVPLGALIASIIKADNHIVPIAIGSIILMGIAISGFVKLIQSIGYYSEGFFKDKYLLDTLNELDYSDIT